MTGFDSCGIKLLLKKWADIMAENKERLIELDSVVGDGDLGLTMSDGFAAAYKAVADSTEKDIGKLSYFAGKAMAAAVPSTMGTLMASGLMNAGKALKGKEELELADLAEFFKAYADGVKQLGKASFGEKTFLDGWRTALDILGSAKSEDDILAVSQKATEAANEDFLATKGMLAVHGRAATRGEQSRSLLDPGAAVAALLMQGFAETVCLSE
jgi:dihydroxyacetone kinase-like protein